MWGGAARGSSDITLPTLGQCPVQVGLIVFCPPEYQNITLPITQEVGGNARPGSESLSGLEPTSRWCASIIQTYRAWVWNLQLSLLLTTLRV